MLENSLNQTEIKSFFLHNNKKNDNWRFKRYLNGISGWRKHSVNHDNMQGGTRKSKWKFTEISSDAL